MDQESLVIGLMLATPAVMGLVAFIAALVLFGTAGKQDKFRVVKFVIGGILLTIALGIGACYGMMLVGGLGSF